MAANSNATQSMTDAIVTLSDAFSDPERFNKFLDVLKSFRDGVKTPGSGEVLPTEVQPLYNQLPDRPEWPPPVPSGSAPVAGPPPPVPPSPLLSSGIASLASLSASDKELRPAIPRRLVQKVSRIVSTASIPAQPPVAVSSSTSPTNIGVPITGNYAQPLMADPAKVERFSRRFLKRDLQGDPEAAKQANDALFVWANKEHDTMNPFTKKQREAITTSWAAIVLARAREEGKTVLPEHLWTREVVEEYALYYLTKRLDLSYGIRGQRYPMARTLLTWLTHFVWMIAKFCIDKDIKLRVGVELLTGGLYTKLDNLMIALVQKFQLRRFRTIKLFLGIDEVLILSRKALSLSLWEGRQVRLQLLSCLVISVFTATRSSSLVASHKDYKERGLFLRFRDFKIIRRGLMIFDIMITIRNFKGGNSTAVAEERVYIIQCPELPDHIFVSPVVIIAYLYSRGAFAYGSLQELFDDKAGELKIREDKLDEPFVLAADFGGKWLNKELEPAAPSSLYDALTHLAKSAGFPPIDFHGLRRGAGHRFGELLGASAGSMLLGHRIQSRTFLTHYSQNTAAIPVVGLMYGEVPADAARAARIKRINETQDLVSVAVQVLVKERAKTAAAGEDTHKGDNPVITETGRTIKSKMKVEDLGDEEVSFVRAKMESEEHQKQYTKPLCDAVLSFRDDWANQLKGSEELMDLAEKTAKADWSEEGPRPDVKFKYLKKSVQERTEGHAFDEESWDKAVESILDLHRLERKRIKKLRQEAFKRLRTRLASTDADSSVDTYEARAEAVKEAKNYSAPLAPLAAAIQSHKAQKSNVPLHIHSRVEKASTSAAVAGPSATSAPDPESPVPDTINPINEAASRLIDWEVAKRPTDEDDPTEEEMDEGDQITSGSMISQLRNMINQTGKNVDKALGKTQSEKQPAVPAEELTLDDLGPAFRPRANEGIDAISYFDDTNSKSVFKNISVSEIAWEYIQQLLQPHFEQLRREEERKAIQAKFGRDGLLCPRCKEYTAYPEFAERVYPYNFWKLERHLRSSIHRDAWTELEYVCAKVPPQEAASDNTRYWECLQCDERCDGTETLYRHFVNDCPFKDDFIAMRESPSGPGLEGPEDLQANDSLEDTIGTMSKDDLLAASGLEQYMPSDMFDIVRDSVHAHWS